MLTIFEELVSVAICSRSNLRSTGLLAPVTHDIALCFTSSIIEGKYLALCKHAFVSPIPKFNPLK